MPELPEVETVRRGLERVLPGHRLARVDQRRPDLRFPLPPDFAARLQGRLVEALDRRAKYLLIRLEGGLIWLVHLGMSGRMVTGPGPAPAPAPHDHVVIETDADTYVVYNDPRRFGFMDLIAEADLPRHPRLAGLGLEPLDDAFDGPALAARLAGKATSIKAALLDQRIVAGLGNIYVCEALYRAGIAPTRLAGSLDADDAARLAGDIKAVLLKAIAAGGSSIRDYVQASGELGYFQHEWAVYGREGRPCPGCDCVTGISRIVQGGRSTFFCAQRQR